MLLDLEPPYLVIKPGVREEEFYALASEDSDWEYLDGRLVMSPASDQHEDLFRFLMTLLSTFLDERKGGVVRGSRYPMRLDERWSPEPDLLVVLDARRHLMTRQRLEGPADFVVEIASEGDPRLDLRDKLPRYRQAGVPEIWMIDPFEKMLHIERKTAAGYETLDLAAGRAESRIVAGFWIDAAWLWQEPLPSTLVCLRQILG
ncbi:MAG TPA: Uma2 family endonuclease [Thermoanaerobaculia bacterium]|jgi:Uma2 family endonuclease|nr:Uma2 family endonuclease [Thermoanaerobaculia bacterium]